MSIYDELLKFQVIPNAYENWGKYRSAIADYLLANTRTHASVAIFGAGRCNDMDLRRFAEHFSSVTLIDSDEAAMKFALRQYHLSDHPGFSLKVSEFTGIAPDDYRAFADELSSLLNVRGIHTDIHVLADYAVFKLEKLYQKTKSFTPYFGSSAFDYSVAFGVHSQINNMAAWIWSAFASNLKADDPSVIQHIIRANEYLIPKLNTAILRATKETAFFGCELAKNGSSDSIQGAYQCIHDLKSRNRITGQAITFWPFDTAQNLVYQMLIQEVDCR